MNRIFCDLCERPIVKREQVRAELTAGGMGVLLVVEQLRNGEEHVDLCRYCIIEAITKLDDRPRPSEPVAHHPV